MDQQLPLGCDPRSPLVYKKGVYLYLIAGQAFQPTYWLATNRMEMSNSQIEQFVIELSYDSTRDILDRFSHTPPSGNHAIDEGDLQRDLVHLIRNNSIKVYQLSSSHYTSEIMEIDNHLTADCNLVDNITHRSEENLEHQRLKLSIELSTILSARWTEKIRVDDIFWAEPWYNRAFIVIGGAFTTIGEGIVGLVKLGGLVIEGLYNANMYQLKIIGQLSQGEFEQVKNELTKLGVEAGEDFTEMKKKIEEGYAIIEPLLEDEKSRKILMDFLSGYIDSVPHVEKSSFVLAIPLEVLLALATMGAGAAVSASRVGMKVGQFSRKSLELIINLSRALNRFRYRAAKKQSGSKGKSSKPISKQRTNSDNTSKIDESSKPLLTDVEFGKKMDSSVELEAKTLIAKGDYSGKAVSKSGVSELGIESPPFVNITPNKVTKFPGVTPVKGTSKYKVTDEKAFLDEIELQYEKSGEPLNSKTKELILKRIRGTEEFDIPAGIPGLHAEVRSANYVLNRVPDANVFDLSKLQVSTYKVSPGKGQGLPFEACSNCGSILEKPIKILTGRKF